MKHLYIRYYNKKKVRTFVLHRKKPLRKFLDENESKTKIDLGIKVVALHKLNRQIYGHLFYTMPKTEDEKGFEIGLLFSIVPVHT